MFNEKNTGEEMQTKKGPDTEVSEKNDRLLNTDAWYEHRFEIMSSMCKHELYQDTKVSKEEGMK